MQNKHYERVISFINQCAYDNDFDEECFETLIDKHFEVDYGEPIDYNMLHFFTEGIIENRIYETLY